MTRPEAYFNPPKRLPFVLPRPPDGKTLVSLAINESAFGCSPKALAAARARLEQPHRYPDPASAALRQAIGRAHGLDPERIICGNGSEELLDVAGRMFVRPGDQILMSQSGFFQFAVVAQRLGAGLVRAGERDLVTDVDAMLGLIGPATKLVFLAVPNNPTGLAMPIAEVRRLHAGLPAHTVLVLDLAYGEYLPPADLQALMALAEASETIIATRTFSKAYGLAAMRVGWMLAPGWMAPGLNMLRGVGNVNAIAQAAAEAAVADPEFVARAVAETARERAVLAATLTRQGLAFVPGLGNFLLTRFPDTPGRGGAEFLPFAMARSGIWLRPVGEPGFANYCRIGIGRGAENALLAECLDAFLNAR